MENFKGSNSSHFYISGRYRMPYVTMRRDGEMGTGWYFGAAAMEAAHWFAALSRELSGKGKKTKRAEAVVKKKAKTKTLKPARPAARALSGAAEPAPNDEIPF